MWIDLFKKVNGLECSSKKTNIILFSNGSGPKELPQFKVDGKDLLSKSEMNFLEYPYNKT